LKTLMSDGSLYSRAVLFQPDGRGTKLCHFIVFKICACIYAYIGV